MDKLICVFWLIFIFTLVSSITGHLDDNKNNGNNISSNNVNGNNNGVDNDEKISGPVALDLTVLPRLVKEAYGGITRFYVNILYILLQYLREVSTNETAISVDQAKLTAERILRGGVDYQEELTRMSQILEDIQKRAAPTNLDSTEYSTTEGIPPGEEIVPPISEQIPIPSLVRNIWNRISNWSRRFIGYNNTKTCCEPVKVDNTL